MASNNNIGRLACDNRMLEHRRLYPTTVPLGSPWVITWAGFGITYRFAGDGGSSVGDEAPRIDVDARTLWRGIAVSATEIWWTAQSL